MAKAQFLAVLIFVVITLSTAHERVKRIVGGRPAAVPPEDDPVVFVYLNDHDARIHGSRDRPGGYYNFRGLRYAEPPVGRFRFQLPDGSEGLPVIMWIHGGGYRRGSASQYGVKHLVNKKLVVVTIQYRLGSLGFLSAGVKELPGNAGMFDMSLALEWIKDYIQFFGGNPNKITVFGQGTGASSAILLSLSQLTQGFLGGVLAMSGSALSAFAIDHNPLATGRELAERNGCPVTPVLEMVKCLQEVPVSTLIQADSGLQELRLAAQGVLAGITGLLGAAPCIDGSNDGRFLPNFLPDSPLDGLTNGKFPKIPLLTGVTRDETSSAVLDLIGRLFNKTEELVQNATGDALFNLPAFQMAKLWSKNVGKTFFYSFEQISKNHKHEGDKFLHGLPLVDNKPITDDGNKLFNSADAAKLLLWSKTNNYLWWKMGAVYIILQKCYEWLYPQFQEWYKGIGHGDDLPFIFDYEPLHGNSSSSDLADDDKRVQDFATNMIAEFARTGEPKVKDDQLWPTFSEEKNDYVTISSNPHPHGNFRFCQMALWGGIFPRLQSATCEALWGITKFSEDALAVVDHAVQQGVGRGLIINTVINNTLAGKVGGGQIMNAVLNKTLPASHSFQIEGFGTEPRGRSGPAIGQGTLFNAMVNAVVPKNNSGVAVKSTTVEVNNTVNEELENEKLTTNEYTPTEIPVTESKIQITKTEPHQPIRDFLANRPTLFPRLANRPTLFPRLANRPIFTMG
ncbi:hypothetical protein C0J52_19622 [Blattella germanica]|nr:hypothetical protein C0J52_19622 [Blattella germanica]